MSTIKKNTLDIIKQTSIQERNSILKKIEFLFPKLDFYCNIEKIEKYNNEIIKYNNYFDTSTIKDSPESLMGSLINNASQQFCFWLDPNNQDIRSLKSSDFYDINIYNNDIYNIINQKAITLRKERFLIAKECEKILRDYFPSSIEKFINDTWIFNTDFFKKKKNLFFMLLWRYRKILDIENLLDSDWINSINPAIDYQIPKILNYFGVITYPTEINEKIRDGIPIEKDSIEELFIRSVAYKALIMIQERYGYNQVELDTFMWYNRNNFNIPKEFKHHCTLTTDY